jgi:GNAT superfamily N-acetyltransferase
MAESYPGHPGTLAATIAADVFSPAPPPAPQPRVALAIDAHGEAAGYMAWDSSYDLHWGIGGAHISDLYVVPSARGRGVALGLIAACCAQVRRAGGAYLRGEAYDAAGVRQFFRRVAVMMPSGEVALGGRAFRRMAELADSSPRMMLSGLPPIEWNHEP